MTDIQFINKIRTAVPDEKDIARASAIIEKIPGLIGDPVCDTRRSTLAITQLKRMTDERKLFRRSKAFLNAGIKIDFGSCKIYSDMITKNVKGFIKGEVKTIKQIEEFKLDNDEDFII